MKKSLRKIFGLIAFTMLFMTILSVSTSAAAAKGYTVYFYSNDPSMDQVYLCLMEPGSSWSTPETGAWPGTQLTKGADGWYSFTLANDPSTYDYAFFFNNSHDNDRANQVKWMFRPQAANGVYTGKELYLVTIENAASGYVAQSDGSKERGVTAFATKAEAEAALGIGATTTTTSSTQTTTASTTAASSTTKAATTAPATGNNGITFLVCLAMLAACAGVVLVKAKSAKID